MILPDFSFDRITGAFIHKKTGVNVMTKQPFVLIFAVLLLGLATLAAAEPAADAEEKLPEAIEYFISGLNTNSLSVAEPYISDDFAIEGVPSEYKDMALNQIFSKFPLRLEGYALKSSSLSNGNRLYVIEVQDGDETKEVEFELDKQGKVLSCSLFSAKEPQQGTSGAEEQTITYAEAEFELVNGIVILPVEMDGRQVKFILDSGAPMLVINSQADTTQQEIIVAAGEGVGGSISSIGLAKVQSLTWAGGSRQDFETISMDLTHLEKELGMEFCGLISKEELEPYETYIDYDAKKICLYLLDEEGNPLEPDRLPKAKGGVKFELRAHIACLNAKVGNKKLTLGLDTGAQTNLLDDDYYGEFEKILQETKVDTLQGADLNMPVIQTGVISETKIGKLAFPDMRYAFYDISDLSHAYNLNIDGLLGYPFLSQRPVSINYRKQTLKLY